MRLVKGSDEAKEKMKKVREAKKGKGFMGDVLKGGTKFLKNELLNKAPLPSFIKDPVSNLADKGIDMAVSKTGLGLKRKYNKKKGAALLLP